MSPLASPNRRAANRDRSRTDARRILAEGGCPICDRVRLSQRRWVSSYINEGNADTEVSAAVRAARGFCPAHLRVFLARPDAPFVLPASQADTVQAWLAEPSVQRRPGQGCPVCRDAERTAADTVAAIAVGGPDPAVQQAIATASICLRHTITLQQAVATPAPVTAFRDRFAELGGIAALTPMTGDDPDADARARLLPALLEADEVDGAAIGRPARERARAVVSGAACGVCRARGVGAVRFLRWLTETRQDLDRTPDTVDTALCAGHLHDLSSLDPLSAGWLADLQHPVIATRLDRLHADLGGGRATARAVARYTAAIRPCPACRAAQVAVERTLDLLAAALPDPQLRTALHAGPGLCVEHAPPLADRAGDELPRLVLRTGLQTLGWELAETRRKREWWTRHERPGSEMGAWRRAPVLLAGDTYLGLPPGADRA